ncbi:hypothetical protein [Roseiconus lacunae]|uniref:hypothetical protein n=1 Tax=Roseiconus lacunae TaxID=2605694 RepID=UPI0011F1B238|nr:hypothetical protein [Roseiconus lacunae]
MILGFTPLTIQFSFFEIQEKWRIRRVWADANPTKMTKNGLHALTVDGANLTLGPLLYGLGAFLLFVVIAIALFIFRILVLRQANRSNVSASLQDTPEANQLHLENPYQPPGATG